MTFKGWYPYLSAYASRTGGWVRFTPRRAIGWRINPKDEPGYLMFSERYGYRRVWLHLGRMVVKSCYPVMRKKHHPLREWLPGRRNGA